MRDCCSSLIVIMVAWESVPFVLTFMTLGDATRVDKVFVDLALFKDFCYFALDAVDLISGSRNVLRVASICKAC